MIASSELPKPTEYPDLPAHLRLCIRSHPGVTEAFDALVAGPQRCENYSPEDFPKDAGAAGLVANITRLLGDENAGAVVLDLGKSTHEGDAAGEWARLVTLAIGRNFGETVTKEPTSRSVFFSVTNRPKERKSPGYGGNGESTNRPGIHTDGSALRSERVDVMGLLCIRQAEDGGESLVSNAVRAFERLSTDTRSFLLQRKFLRQNPYDMGHPNPKRRSVYGVVKTPVRSGLGIMYHRSRIEGGHRSEGLNAVDAAVLDQLDAALWSPRNSFAFKLKPGELLLLNNHTHCHDRFAFRDIPGKERLLERYWAGVFVEDDALWRQ